MLEDSWGNWLKPCAPLPLWSASPCLQHEPESSAGPLAVEDVLPRFCPEDILVAPRTPDWRPTAWRPRRDSSWISSGPWSGQTWIPSSRPTSPAIIYLLNRVYAHLDKLASSVRVMFVLLVQCFQHHQASFTGRETHSDAGGCPRRVSWIVNYLTGRPQYVRLQHCVSDRVVSSTGAPQGTVLSPFLFPSTPQINAQISLLLHLLFCWYLFSFNGIPVSKQCIPNTVRVCVF